MKVVLDANKSGEFLREFDIVTVAPGTVVELVVEASAEKVSPEAAKIEISEPEVVDLSTEERSLPKKTLEILQIQCGTKLLD